MATNQGYFFPHGCPKVMNVFRTKSASDHDPEKEASSYSRVSPLLMEKMEAQASAAS
jgi:hypothetical protein